MRDYWPKDRKPTQNHQAVYFIPKGSHTPTRVIDDMKQPNGIIGTPDGHTLYVADIAANQTFSYTSNPDGSLSNKTPFCPQGSDGMTIDDENNLYLTNKA